MIFLKQIMKEGKGKTNVDQVRCLEVRLGMAGYRFESWSKKGGLEIKKRKKICRGIVKSTSGGNAWEL